MQELKLSLAITTFERYEMTLNAFSSVVGHHLIDEVVIVDDHSTPAIWNKLKDLPRFNSKVKVFRNDTNLGMSLNKVESVRLCKNDWVILFDSDNTLTHEYLNAIPSDLDPQTIYIPDFARPNFDFRAYAGDVINATTIAKYKDLDDFWTMLNTCNYLVPRDLYVSTFRANRLIKETDTLWFAYLWITAGFSFKVLPGMQYEHLVHKDSGWLRHADYNLDMHRKLKTQILKECQ
jgi:glycosyltransferase involved in cell wall biosynthesis